MGGQTKGNEMKGCETTMVFNTMHESHGGGKKDKRKCTMVLWEGALAIGIRTIATMVIVANAFNIDHPNYVLKNVCDLVDKN